MKRSTDRIISSHAGTLPRPEGFPEVFFGAVENPTESDERATTEAPIATSPECP